MMPKSTNLFYYKFETGCKGVFVKQTFPMLLAFRTLDTNGLVIIVFDRDIGSYNIGIHRNTAFTRPATIRALNPKRRGQKFLILNVIFQAITHLLSP
jgi:hypothetical protein